MTKVNASICPNCWDLIFSRACHDFHHCSCKEIFIDGGFDYVRGGWNKEFPYSVTYEIEQSKDELFKDYNLRIDKYGIIKDWKLSILNFFNKHDGRLVKAVKDFIEQRVWPENFPIDHLTFPEDWKTQLTLQLLVAVGDDEEND